MASMNKTCRVCGKEYEACRSANRTAGVFRWQEVACSPECGALYIEKIIESRKPANVIKRNSRKKEIPEIMVESAENDTADHSISEEVIFAEDD